LSCGGGPVARRAHDEFWTKCSKENLRKKNFEEEQAQEQERREIFKGRSHLRFPKTNEPDLFWREVILFQNFIYGRTAHRLAIKLFAILWFRKFGGIVREDS
jgi:hypothetical protein